MSKKAFPTIGVCGLAKGITLGPFSDIHGVFDHLYPGIMTIGCAAMAKVAAAEILRQHPAIAELGTCDEANWREWRDRALLKFGDGMEVEGPHAISDAEVSAEFAKLGAA